MKPSQELVELCDKLLHFDFDTPPFDKHAVQLHLRLRNQPICFFNETNVEQRERLRKLWNKPIVYDFSNTAKQVGTLKRFYVSRYSDHSLFTAVCSNDQLSKKQQSVQLLHDYLNFDNSDFKVVDNFQYQTKSLKLRCICTSASYIATADESGGVFLFNPFQEDYLAQSNVMSVVNDIISLSDSSFITACLNGTVKILKYDPTESSELTIVKDIQQHNSRVNMLSINSTNDYILSVSNDCSLNFTDLNTYEKILVAKTDGHYYHSCRFHPAHPQLALLGDNAGFISLFDCRTDEISLIIDAHLGKVTDLDWHPCLDTLFLSGGFDCVSHLWDLRSPAVQKKLSAKLNRFETALDSILCHTRTITSSKFQKQTGQYIITASNDGKIIYTDLKTMNNKFVTVSPNTYPLKVIENQNNLYYNTDSGIVNSLKIIIK